MGIDRDTILKVSKLARLELKDEEIAEFSGQLSDILSYVEKINELDTDTVKPSDHIVDLKNVFRDDETGPSIKPEEIEKMAPQFEGGHIIVPKIIEGS